MLSAKQVPPGQTGQIEVSVHTQGLTVINKAVTVETNDPRQAQLTLTLMARVQPEFNLPKRFIFFGSVPAGREVTEEILISVFAESPAKLLSAESTDQNVTVSLELVPGSEGRQAKLVAVQKADTKEGYHFGMVNIKTTSTRTPEIKIPVRGMVTAAQHN